VGIVRFDPLPETYRLALVEPGLELVYLILDIADRVGYPGLVRMKNIGPSPTRAVKPEDTPNGECGEEYNEISVIFNCSTLSNRNTVF
jgi:hypothetical protein